MTPPDLPARLTALADRLAKAERLVRRRDETTEVEAELRALAEEAPHFVDLRTFPANPRAFFPRPVSPYLTEP